LSAVKKVAKENTIERTMIGMKIRFMEMPEDRMASISLLLDRSPMTMLEAVNELKGKV
jgi:hypothetical protein